MSRRVQQLIDLLEPTVESLGYELIDLEFNSSLLRLYINGPNGVNVEDCAKVSHHVSGVLDVEDPIKSEYELEVSSPGVDRIIRTTSHYEEFVGCEVSVRLKRPDQNRRKLTGLLKSVSENEVVLQVDDETIVVKRDNIDKTRLVPVFDV